MDKFYPPERLKRVVCVEKKWRLGTKFFVCIAWCDHTARANATVLMIMCGMELCAC